MWYSGYFCSQKGIQSVYRKDMVNRNSNMITPGMGLLPDYCRLRVPDLWVRDWIICESALGQKPSITFLLQSPRLASGASLGLDTKPVRRSRSSRTCPLLELLFWISAGKNPWTGRSSSLETGLHGRARIGHGLSGVQLLSASQGPCKYIPSVVISVIFLKIRVAREPFILSD